MLIRAENVTKIHRLGEHSISALRNVSCSIPQGQFLFIVGPSGSGKSSLLYVIGALDDVTSGEVYVDEKRLSSFTPSQRDEYRRRQVGFVFQSFNLLRNLNAVDNVLVPFFPVGITPELRDQAVSLLERMGMGARLTHRPNQLSGGEQQRVALVRAILKRPSLILADEPTGELDSQTGADVFRILRELSREIASTVVVVTHDTRYITPGDRILKMQDGEIIGEQIA
ncbi:MAG: ABC transporter ATP-binding protein [Planctomycetaceae bacterium]